MQTTGNFGLKKPGNSDVVNIEDLNYNADKIDTQMKINANAVTTHTSATMPHQFTDSGRIYRWGLSVSGGILYFNYEEVL